MINDDFTNGDPDYCTSCELEVKPVLDIGGDKPTCVLDVPDKRAVLVIQNNKMLGVSANVTQYGGESSSGNRTDDASTPPDSDKMEDLPDDWQEGMDDMFNAGNATQGNGTMGPPGNGTGSGSGSGSGNPPPQRRLANDTGSNDTSSDTEGFSDLYPPPMNSNSSFVDYMKSK